jgi:hypothetical protein
LEVDEAQAAAVVDEDRGAPVVPLGEFAFHLREESDFSQCHLMDGDALPRLGGDKDLVRGLSFFATPRNLSHRAEKAASALGWRDFCQLLGDFPVEGKLFELCEGKVTKAVVPLHQFSLIVGGGEMDVLSLFRWR